MRQNVTRVVEMDDFFQTLKVAFLPVRLYEPRIRPLVDITDGYRPESTVELRRQCAPRRIAVFWAAEESANAQIYKRRPLGITDIAILIRLRLRVVRQRGVLRDAEGSTSYCP